MADTIVYQGRRFLKLSAPEQMNGKKLSFEQIFRSAFHEPSLSRAEKNLASIRELHGEADGWKELDAWIEHYPDGYVAVRYHVRYT